MRDPENTSEKKVLLVDTQAGDRGHLLDDDLFMTECLAPLADEIEVISSPAIVKNIETHLKVKAYPLKEYRALRRFPRIRSIFNLAGLDCSPYSDVIFQSFEEISILLFFLLHPKKRIHLIATNNISRERMNRHPVLWRFLMNATLKRASSIFVHSRFESDFIKEVCHNIDPARIFIKPFHQISFDRVRSELSGRTKNILFMGPLLARKPVEPLIELIKADEKRRYNYNLLRMDGIDSDSRAFFEAQPNVTIGFGYISDDEYYRHFSESMFVLMTHNHLFEGKLSGVFCDAIASGTPVIARGMAPHDEFFERFGDMGYLFDFENAGWSKNFLGTDPGLEYGGFQRNMSTCRESCSMEAIRAVFRSTLFPE